MHECRTERVRMILQFEGRSNEHQSAYEEGMAEIAGAKHWAAHYKHKAKALKSKLTPEEVHQLRRARSGV